MGQHEVQTGFELWAAEANNFGYRGGADAEVHIITLAGLYVVAQHNNSENTSFAWRRTVLASSAARAGLAAVLTDVQAEDLSDEDTMPIAEVAPLIDKLPRALQHKATWASIRDGLPANATQISVGEHFLAHTLGQAGHNFAIALNPLRILEAGRSVIHNFYPHTAAYILESNE